MALSRRFVVLAGVALMLLPLTACSKDSKRPSAAPVSSSSSATPPPTTASVAPGASAPCSASAPPASAINVTHASGDFNGDNMADTLTVYGTGTTTQPSPYHVQIELGGSGGIVDTVIADAATDNNVSALGGADISSSAGLPPDGSGAEAFVHVNSGVSDAEIGVFQLIGCALTRLTGPQGSAPSLFPVGGAVVELHGLRCDGTAGGPRLVQLSATSTDGVSYATKATRLQVQDGKFSVLGTPVTGTLDFNSAQQQGFGGLECPGVQAP